MTAYCPATACKLERFAARREPSATAKHLLAAAASDPEDDRPWKELARFQFNIWAVTHKRADFERWEKYASEFLVRRPRSATAWASVGDGFIAAGAGGGANSYRDKAIGAYRRAAEIYPSQSLFRAKLALALDGANCLVDSRQQAADALWLDAMMPHPERKLSASLLRQLKEIERGATNNSAPNGCLPHDGVR